ncbi:MAG: DNA polymerase II large subunit [Candidatus Rehaiarchaeum fermentans]|nr:DNA polymerase II large subunit [Candidatus Rehaiarchaeum fermentans]
MEISEYFKKIDDEVKRELDAISKIKKVSVPIARNAGERIEGLLSVIRPDLIGSGLANFIEEQNKKYPAGDWHIALNVAISMAKGQFIKFQNEVEAIEMGIRAGLAYQTAGIVSAPLEGFIKAELKDRLDKKGKYLAIYFGGPIRGAGGTDAAFTVVVADLLRKLFNLEKYDPTYEEIQRFRVDSYDYYEKEVKYQYLPTEKEIEFFVKNLPVEIDGEPTSDLEVSAFKDLPRIKTNRIRGGMVLVLSSFIQKSPKVLKKLKGLKNEYGFEQDFDWLEELVKIKEEVNAQGDAGGELKPNYKYLEEIAAGRPIFSFPLASGGFRLRYGRSRTSGLAATSIHPATSIILNNFIATGTQLKVEFPGKATAITFCDSIEGPIVKLKDESVIKVKDKKTAELIKDEVKEILYLGDMLVSFGEFTQNNHILAPSPFVEEWWDLIVEKKGLEQEAKKITSFEQMVKFCKDNQIPLHPKYLYYWSQISKDQLINLINYVRLNSKIEYQTSFNNEYNKTLKLPYDKDIKRTLELIGIEHKLISNEIIIENADPFIFCIGLQSKEIPEGKDNLEILSKIAGIEIKDIAGTFIGARQARPEKAKMREMEGHPNVIFPIGEYGGNSRNISSAPNKIKVEIGKYKCEKCNKYTIYSKCEICGSETTKIYKCRVCKKETTEKEHCKLPTLGKFLQEIDLQYYLSKAYSKVLAIKNVNKLTIKGVKGIFNNLGEIEELEKGILRASYGLLVNKDGTIRFDAIEVPITHFKPKEIHVSIQKLKELGYERDIYGKELENEDQILQLFPQDIILPTSSDPNQDAADVLLRISKFVDDLLVLNGAPPLFNAKSKEDLIGKLIVGLAPHTSSGIVGRIIGFSKTRGYFAHPYFHASMRRNCDGDEAGIILLADLFLNFNRYLLPSTRGAQYMDNPLVISTVLDPESADPEVQELDIVSKYPLELYEASLRYAPPSEVKSLQLKSIILNDPFGEIRFTHDTTNINDGVNISAYKELDTMADKIASELDLEKKIRAVDVNEVAKILVDKHLLKDIKGNLRNFGFQEFRCVKCNYRYRRPTFTGKCTKCGGNLVPITSKGNIVKYLQITQDLVNNYDVGDYLREEVKIISSYIKEIFGTDEKKPKNATLFSV